MSDELNNLSQNFIEVKREAVARTNEAIDLINNKLGLHLKYPTVRFALKGGTAGKAWWRENLIEYNPTLLQNNVDDFLRQTVRHEVAHLGARAKWGGGIKPHGKEWCSCCWFLGIPATRCHNYDTALVPTRALSSQRGTPVRRMESGIVIHTGVGKITRFED